MLPALPPPPHEAMVAARADPANTTRIFLLICIALLSCETKGVGLHAGGEQMSCLLPDSEEVINPDWTRRSLGQDLAEEVLGSVALARW